MSLLVFNVYEPPNAAGDRLDRAERLVFIKDGFHWMAALFPVIWLPLKGLWLELLAFLVGVGVLAWVLEALGAHNDFLSVILLIVQIVIGFEASNIRGAALERKGWRMAGAVAGRNREECEARFLARWLAEEPYVAPPTDTLPPERSGPPGNWLSAAWHDVTSSFSRGRQLART